MIHRRPYYFVHMISKHTISISLLPALTSSGIFLLMLAIGLGFPFLFLSLLPIFSVGLGKNPRYAMEATLIASAVIVMLTGALSLGVMFVFFLGLPAWYFCYLARHALLFGEHKIWYPVGNIIAQLSVYACVLIGMAVVYYASETGGITAVVSAKIREAFTAMPAEYEGMVNTLADHWNFMLFSMLAWMWGAALYGHAWLANRRLVKTGKAQRESLAVTVFAMPGWMLYLLFVAALASLIGSESMRFAGKACFTTLLLPYFFLGLAIIHRSSNQWPNRRFFLFFIYLMIASQLWMMAIVAGIGVVSHLLQINKRLSSGQISPK